MLIGLTGYARCGKDSAANYLVEHYGFTKLGFADGVREVALGIDPNIDYGVAYFTTPQGVVRYTELLKTVGYERAKACPDVRRLLQRIGTEGVRDVLGEDVWRNLLAQKLVKLAGDDWPKNGNIANSVNVVVSDVRFPNEAEFIKANGGFVVRIARPGFGGNDPHPSEAQIAGLNADFDISATDLTALFGEIENVHNTILVHPAYSNIIPEGAAVATVVEPAAPRVYLAAPWVHKADAGIAKKALQDAGIEVVSGWTEREDSPQETAPEEMVRQAGYDYAEVQKANTLVILNLAKSEGKASEMGMALAYGHRVIVVGPRTGNIFYHLPQVEQVDSVQEAIFKLTGADYAKNVQTGEV